MTAMDPTRIAAAGILETWSGHAWTNGVQLDSIPDFTEIHVRTRNSVYAIQVIEGASREVLVRGGRFFPEWTPAHLAGASMGGSFLKVGGVYVGFKLEIVSGDRTTITSRAESISVHPPSP